MFRKNKKKNKGFTLVETLIAIAILMISVAAPLSLAAKGLEVVALSKDHIVADFLAQEAFEWIKNKTDYNKNAHSAEAEGLVYGLDNCIDKHTTICKINATDGYTIDPLTDGSDDYLRFNGTTYQYTDGEYTKFKRWIHIKKYKNPNNPAILDEISVIVKVRWQTPSGEQEYVYQSNITNW